MYLATRSLEGGGVSLTETTHLLTQTEKDTKTQISLEGLTT